MSMEMPKDAAVLDPRVVESRAEVLFAMDLLMHHLNDEDDIEGWLMNGVPDGAPCFACPTSISGIILHASTTASRTS